MGTSRGSVHGLGELVVIDQDELARHGFEEVALGNNAGEAAVAFQDGEGKLRGEGDFALGLGQGGLRGNGEEILVEHVFGPHGAAGEDGGRGVVRRNDDGYAW